MNNDFVRDRNYCLSILQEYTKSDSLLKHAYAVESCVKAYAEKFGEDVNYWSNVALLHDFDYEMFPTAEEPAFTEAELRFRAGGHPFKGSGILKEKGFDEEFRNSIMSHANYANIPRDTLLKKTLFACDELAGFITAVTYVRPSRSIDEVEVKSVIKKMKDKAFARAVNRDDITKGAQELGVPIEEHIQFCINAMKKNKELLGL